MKSIIDEAGINPRAVTQSILSYLNAHESWFTYVSLPWQSYANIKLKQCIYNMFTNKKRHLKFSFR